ncbi:Hypothetical predicted protein [Pelobates cultripes]|uniref:Uncharacterized protein n=1 Tax=Pelobates cultripes TaxID=61616 RepID=A0AAD1W8Q6_PELCU|nr:Hypothetical predicted protein [Pelobates cultripes]
MARALNPMAAKFRNRARKEDFEALTEHTIQAETDIMNLKAKTAQHNQDIFYLSDKLQFLEDNLDEEQSEAFRKQYWQMPSCPHSRSYFKLSYLILQLRTGK